MRHVTTALVLVLMLGLLLSSSQAQTGKQQILRTITAEQLAEMFQEWGYRAEISVSSTGRHSIDSATGGLPFSVVFYDKKGDGVYEDINLLAWFGTSYEGTVTDANAWNIKKRHAFAIFDSSDDTVGLQMDLTLKGGVTGEYLASYFKMWELYLMEFQSFLAEAH